MLVASAVDCSGFIHDRSLGADASVFLRTAMPQLLLQKAYTVRCAKLIMCHIS